MARRLEAFGALHALLAKLAEEQPLVLAIDDLQWADSESFRMLHALIERLDPPPFFLIATVRPRDELEPQMLERIKWLRSLACTEVIPLFGLSKAHSKALAAKLLGTSVSSSMLDAVAEESGGNPLFLGELVLLAQRRDISQAANLTLEAALRARIEWLDPPARALLEMAALAARPHGAHVFARALGAGNVDEPAQQLLSAKLLRVRKGQELGCFHDRIRHTVCDLVGPARSIPLHRRLAAAIAADPASDPVEQAHDQNAEQTASEIALARLSKCVARGRTEDPCFFQVCA